MKGMRIWKKTLAFVIAACIVLSATAVFAAPEYIGSGAAGNTSGLITITNPNAQKIHTLEKTYYVAGYGISDVRVYFYSFNGSSYQMMRSYGAPVSLTIGASGLFMKKVTLKDGKNNLLIRAEDYHGRVQHAYHEITLVDQGIRDYVNGRIFPGA